MEKTNVMRILDGKKIPYTPYEYSKEMTEGVLIAAALGEDNTRVFKTLVTEGASRNHYVFVIPVAETLNLKKAAKSVGEKSVAMIKQKELLPLTGYIHGGCSPIGMKKLFKTVIHITAKEFETFFVSAGRIGKQIEINSHALAELISASFEDIII